MSKSTMIIDGKTYQVRGMRFTEYLTFSRSVLSKTIVKAPFEPTRRNIERLRPDVVFSLIASVLLLTANELNRELKEMQKVTMT